MDRKLAAFVAERATATLLLGSASWFLRVQLEFVRHGHRCVRKRTPTSVVLHSDSHEQGSSEKTSQGQHTLQPTAQFTEATVTSTSTLLTESDSSCFDHARRIQQAANQTPHTDAASSLPNVQKLQFRSRLLTCRAHVWNCDRQCRLHPSTRSIFHLFFCHFLSTLSKKLKWFN